MEAVTRKEKILDGQDLTPVTRKEYFLQKAATGGGGGADIYIGTYLTLSDAPPLPEGYTAADEYLTHNAVPIYVSYGSELVKYFATYPAMPEAKPAFVLHYLTDGEISVGVPDTIYEPDPSDVYDPLVEDASENIACLTLNTAVSPAVLDISTSSDVEGVITIEKSNLKWVLYDTGK